MKQNYTHFILILDKSGSMAHLQKATIEGVNSLIEKQKADPGDFTSAVYMFNENVFEVSQFSKLDTQNYCPCGSTALLDAVGDAVTKEGVALAKKPEAARPDKVVVAIVTDGEENASIRYKLDAIKKLISQQQNDYKWQFVFLGANIDAFAAGSTFGVSMKSTMQFSANPDSVRAMYAATSSSLSDYKSGVAASVDLSNKTA